MADGKIEKRPFATSWYGNPRTKEQIIAELDLAKRRCVDAVRKGLVNVVGFALDDIHELQRELEATP
jgi:hypothetical protein